MGLKVLTFIRFVSKEEEETDQLKTKIKDKEPLH